MAWSTPLTAVANAVLTAAQWNASVRDNLLMTAPALATTAGSYFAVTGTNAIAQRVPSFSSQNGVETTTSASYTGTLSGGAGTAGPSLTVTTGTKALVIWACRQSNSSAGANVWTSYAVTGASSISPSDNYALSYDSPVAGSTCYHAYSALETSLTAGSNVFQMQYRASSGTASFGQRRLTVLPF